MTRELYDPTRIDITYDPREEIMAGVAIHGNTPFECPYISHIAGNLWQGGCFNGLVLPEDIVHVISLYKWEQYVLHDGVRTHEQITAYDSDDDPNGLGGMSFEQIFETAEKVVECCADGPTLVHCQAGLNRSSLIAAVALVLMGEVETGEEAVALLREKRSPACLCNKAFEKWIVERFARFQQPEAGPARTES